MKNSFSRIVWCIVLASAPLAQAYEPSDVPEVIVPFLREHCADCHGPEKQKGDLALHVFRDEISILKARKTWMRVIEQLHEGEMPPEKRPRPAAEELGSFVDAVRGVFEHYDRTAKPDPGPAPLRRLNRVEYANTVRDLLDLDLSIPLAADFPSDAVTYGFENNAGALTLSPGLLDRYLASAEMVAGRAIRLEMPERTVHSAARALQPGRKGGFKEELEFRLMDSGSTERHYIGPLWSKDPSGAGGKDSILHHAATDDFIFRAIVYAELSNRGPVQAALFIAGPDLPDYSPIEEVERLAGGGVGHREIQPMKILKTFEVTASSSREPQRVEMVVSRKGRIGRIAAMGIALVKPMDGDPPAQLFVKLESEGPLPPRSHKVLLAASPDKSSVERTREVLGRLLPRAFRRPVTESEIESAAVLSDRAVSEGLPWEVGIQRALMGILCSPKFLYRVESDDRHSSTEPHPIGEYELASRLSYFLWSTMPDEELFDLAAKGKLTASLEQQVRRMLKDPRSDALVDGFFAQWLQLDALERHAPDPTLFPRFDHKLRKAMLTETRMFLNAIIQEDRSLLELIRSDYTFLNHRLGEHYGIVDTFGNRNRPREVEDRGKRLPETHFVRVPLKDDERGGLLTQASILTLTSSAHRTSPVKRGAWILDKILGTPSKSPPPNIPDLDEEKAVGPATVRQQLEQHRADPACASCHAQIDPLGFPFENYDAVGAFREKDSSGPIDATGTLPDGRVIEGMETLRSALLEEKKAFVRNLAERMLIYALGRGLEYYDQRTVDQIVAAVEQDDYRLSSLVLAVVQSDAFRLRRGKKGKP